MKYYCYWEPNDYKVLTVDPVPQAGWLNEWSMRFVTAEAHVYYLAKVRELAGDKICFERFVSREAYVEFFNHIGITVISKEQSEKLRSMR